MRRLPVPLPFLAVAAATVALFIFFGAWAVSADVEDRDRAFSFGFPVAAETSATTSASYYRNAPGDASGNPNQQLSDQSLAETWWGKSLIRACPLH